MRVGACVYGVMEMVFGVGLGRLVWFVNVSEGLVIKVGGFDFAKI